MENKICPKTSKCPLFMGESISIKDSVDIYKRIYCNNGLQGRKDCKRYQVSDMYGKPNDDLLPNDPRNVNEIIQELIDKENENKE